MSRILKKHPKRLKDLVEIYSIQGCRIHLLNLIRSGFIYEVKHNFNRRKCPSRRKVMESSMGCTGQAFAALAGCNVILSICVAVLCAYIAPAAAGSSIHEVKAYLNGVDAHSILAPSTLFVKVCPSINSILTL
ncbi:chloride channel protein [Artemisia annua]|uniref:Chloride channel protein n=1 Tax=Artemisia annua TaxID=35608 RepID=A0A2U1NKC7_ARTAN|nr:chloride channel protein [Artemisia annua]